MTTYVAIKNELKVAIPSEYLYIQPSSNEKISCTLVSLIKFYGDSLDCGHYVSAIFYGSTGIWWHCDDDNINQISDLQKGVYYIERVTKTQKRKKYVRINICIICCLYQNNLSNKTHLFFF